MIYFLSCDWGTSSFRLRLVEAENLEIMAVQKSQEGIADTFSRLGEKEKKDPEERLLFYLLIIQEHIAKIEQEKNLSLEGVPLVVSGMASSSIGMAELPYQSLPFSIDGKGIGAAFFEASAKFAHPVLLISGIKSETDVMRGEETQLIGAILDGKTDGLYIFPGTHSKHIWVKDKQVTGFKTYMTGEFFRLLSEKSILKEGVEENDEWQNPICLQRFKDGVRDAQGANLLHIAFRARTNDLFGKLTKRENFNYLSGLLIGSELETLATSDDVPVYVCGDSRQSRIYEAALDALGIKERAHVFPAQWADEAVVRGQFKIYNHFSHRT
jgi:2-dehydro-3-deoxygalactonokinase